MRKLASRPARFFLALLLVLPSTGCQSGSAAPRIADIPVADRAARADAIVGESPRNDAAYQQRLLTAAMLYNSAEAYAKALTTLNLIETSRLPREFRGDFLVASVDAGLGAGDVESAWKAVARGREGRYPFVDDLVATDHARVSERRARVLERRGLVAEALRERIVAGERLVGNDALANNEAVWALALKLDAGAARQLTPSADAAQAGWLALAQAWRETADSNVLRAARINAWMAANPAHPAAMHTPTAIARLRSIDTQSPVGTRIAILLPQHGKLADAGEAIRRGLLSAWYNASEAGAPMPALLFLDSSREDFTAVYHDAVKAGAGLVIGPLEKENLRALQQLPSLPVPTLALNYAEGGANPRGLHYFGLAGEDEGAQLAATVLAANLQNIALVFPAADWGQRVAQQTEQALLAGGARVQSKSPFTPDTDFHEMARRMLDVGSSEKRHAQVESAVGESLAFKPRRRTDIDGVILVANTPQAVQILPAIRYYHGMEMPAFGTSHVNSQPGPTSANDLDGLHFIEMPWLAVKEQPLLQRLKAAWQDTDERYLRLYPLGIDALRIAQQLDDFSSTPAARIEGTTGVLTMDGSRRVHRQLSRLVYRNGSTEADDGPH